MESPLKTALIIGALGFAGFIIRTIRNCRTNTSPDSSSVHAQEAAVDVTAERSSPILIRPFTDEEVEETQNDEGSDDEDDHKSEYECSEYSTAGHPNIFILEFGGLEELDDPVIVVNVNDNHAFDMNISGTPAFRVFELHLLEDLRRYLPGFCQASYSVFLRDNSRMQYKESTTNHLGISWEKYRREVGRIDIFCRINQD